VASALAGRHDVSLTDLPANAAPPNNVQPSDLGHDEATDELVRGIDAVVHIAFGGHGGSPTELLDYHTRCTYNLLTACTGAGVKRVICLSTLRLMEDWDENLSVTERWRSTPRTEQELLAAHLNEYVCREFAREGRVQMALLRLGFPIIAGSRSDAEASGETAALATDDLALVLEKALTSDLPQWQVIHVQSPVPRARYLLGTAQSVLSYPSAPKEATR
jgi:nucleoside-diphosphate-sugar epimerase